MRKTKAQLEEAKINRQITVQNMLMHKKSKYADFLSLEIPKEVLQICEDSGLSMDQLKAIRQYFINQFGAEIEKKLKTEFVEFYDKEIMKSHGLQLNLTKKKLDANGDLKIKANDKFLEVMKDYFVQITEDALRDNREVGSNMLESAESHGFASSLVSSGEEYSESDGQGGRRRRKRGGTTTRDGGRRGKLDGGDSRDGPHTDRGRRRRRGSQGSDYDTSEYSYDS